MALALSDRVQRLGTPALDVGRQGTLNQSRIVAAGAGKQPTQSSPIATPDRALSAADIPCFWMSRAGVKMGPGGGLVVGAAGLEAAVEDADKAVAELAQGGLVAGAAFAQGLVVRAGAG